MRRRRCCRWQATGATADTGTSALCPESPFVVSLLSIIGAALCYHEPVAPSRYGGHAPSACCCPHGRECSTSQSVSPLGWDASQSKSREIVLLARVTHRPSTSRRKAAGRLDTRWTACSLLTLSPSLCDTRRCVCASAVSQKRVLDSVFDCLHCQWQAPSAHSQTDACSAENLTRKR